MKLNYINKKDSECCGCGACAAICPKKAIKLTKDSLGFAYPTVLNENCINCGACIKVCPFELSNQKKLVNEPSTETYVAILKDDFLLSNASSGGAFPGLAKYVLEQNGVVFGATWNSDFSVEHIKIDNIKNLSTLQGSKYIQSNISECYSDIKELLDNEKMVLFAGTPCQIAALKSFLNKQYNSLYTIDLICHGVGSPTILHDEINFLEKKHGKKLNEIKFRSKRKGWGTIGELNFNGKIKPYSVTNSAFYYYYLQNALFRDSCYNCKYASDQRPADITIGDYWKVESAHPNIKIKTKKGVSCLLVNTKKGSELIRNTNSDFNLIPSTLEKIKQRNGQLKNCCQDNGKKSKILKIYQESKYEGLHKYYRKTEFNKILKLKAISLIPDFVKKKIKRTIKNEH